MSAYFAVTFEDRIEILTDGAVYTPDGVMVATARKIWFGEGAPLAVFGRGSHEVLESFATDIVQLASVATFDMLIAGLDRVLQARKSKVVPGPVEVIIAGWDEAGIPRMMYFATVEMGDVQPFTIIECGPQFIGGPYDQISHEEIEGALDLSTAPGSLADVGVPLFELMRSKKAGNPAVPVLPEMYGIGGHIDLTTIT